MEDTITISRAKYHRLIEVLFYIASYDAVRASAEEHTDHTIHLRDKARRTLKRDWGIGSWS